MPSTRRAYCRRAVGLLVVAAGCSGRPGSSSPSTADTPVTATGGVDERTATATATAEETTSLVLHGADADDLPRRAQVGVLSPEVWDWVTTAAETGAADVGVEDGWTPTFPSKQPTSTPAPGSASGTGTESRGAPRVDLAVAAADVLVVEGRPYAVRTTYRAAEASYRLKTVRVGATEEADPPEATDTVANVASLPPDQRRIARVTVRNETGYAVGYHEERSEAFEAVSEYDYLHFEGETYWTFTVHGDRFLVHTTLWAEPVEQVGEDDVVFAVKPVTLSERGREAVTAAIESPAATVETVPETLADATATYDALATTTALYRA
jgi:hypothetical protein